MSHIKTQNSQELLGTSKKHSEDIIAQSLT